MSPLAAKLLKPTSPLLHPDSALESDDEMVYAPYYTTHRRSSSTSKRRRSHQLTPEDRAEIVARVLDPAYSGRKATSRVFVDPNGDEHDPDYQLFPTQPIRHRRTNGFPRNSSEEDLSQDGYDSEVEWTRSRAASPSSTATSASPQPNPMSLFGDDEWDEKEWTREIVVPVPQSKRCHRKAKATPIRASSPQPVTITTQESHSSIQLADEEATTEDAPSYGYVLRRQWATITLHTRLSAHRIARRARRAVSVGT